MAKRPPKLDAFEENIFKLGYKPIAEIKLKELNDPRNHKRVYPNIYPLATIVRDLGFQEDTIIRVRFFDNEYFGTVYTKKE